MFYAHDADGEVERLMHPDGHEVVYQRDAARRVTAVTLIEPDGTDVALITGAEWEPFGGISGFTYGNGLSHSRSYDAAGRITSIQTSPVQALSLAWDATDNLTAIADLADSARSQAFGYDALYRLTDASGAYGMLHYQYDAVGNRKQRIADDIVTDYAYAPDSNRLESVDEQAFTYDTAGNTLTDGERAFTYDARNRMAEADGHRYGYNALGQRVYKPRMGVAGDVTGDGQVTEADLGLLQQALKGESATTMAMDCNQDGVVNRRDTACLASKIGAFKNQGQHQGQGQGGPPAAEDHAEELVQVGWILFLYDESGQLIGEYDEHGTPLRQYVWLDNIPVAMRDADGIYYLHADHLNTPKLATDTAGEVVWRADYRPFGEVTETVDEIEVNLRFPGQYHDRETGLHQNWHREYVPGIGRYTQSDPIGLNGEINIYNYVKNNPLSNIDPVGLMSWTGTATMISASYGAGAVRYSFNLESECIDGRRAKVRVIAGGSVLGISYAIGFTHSNVTFNDSNGANIDPFVFQGRAIYASAGYSFIGVAGSWAYIILGDAVSRGWSYTPGLEATIGWGVGHSRVNGVQWENCDEC